MLLYRLAEERLGADGAARSVLYLAVFPMALFLQAVYSESLFLLLSLAAFSLAERGRFAGAGVVAGLAILTRVAGLALLPALAVLAWRHRERLRALGKLALALPVAAIYPLVLWQQVGDPLAFSNAAGPLAPAPLLGGAARRASGTGCVAGGAGSSSSSWATARTSRGTNPMHAAAENVAGARLLVLFIGLTVVAWRRLGAAYGVFAAVSLAIPLELSELALAAALAAPLRARDLSALPRPGRATAGRPRAAHS